MQNPSHYNGLDFIILVAQDLPGVFRLIEPGLLEIQRKARLDWDIGILPTMIAANQATLTALHEPNGGRYAGFVITRSVFKGSPNRHFMEVVAPYIEPWCHAEGLDGVAAIDLFVTDFAQSLGCRGILETATRIGWTKRLERLGYRIGQVTMIKEF